MKKKIIIVGIMAAILMIAGCWSMYEGKMMQSEHEEIPFVIGVSQANMKETWRINLIEEIKNEAEKHENIRIITTDAISSTRKQEQDIDKLLGMGIDLLIISPCDSSTMTAKVKEVYRQNVPVIVMDRVVEGFDYSLFIGPDNELIGELGARSVIDVMGEQSGTILELCASADSIQSRERKEGFEKEIKNYPNVRTLVCGLEGEMKDAAYDKIQEMKDQLQDIQIIFANNDAVALGAYNALADMQMETQIPIVGCDGFTGEEGGIQLVREGRLAATISCPTGGKEAVEYALDILQEKTGVPKQVILRSHTITEKSAADYLAESERSYYDDGKKIRMGYSQVGSESNFRKANSESLIAAAKEFNIDLMIDNADQSQEKQIESIRKFIRQKVDVIVVSPVIETGWDEVLKDAQAAGIPVIMSDRKIQSTSDLTATYIGADFIEEGRRAMRWIQANTELEKEVLNIMEIQGNPGASPTVERKQGFMETLGENRMYRLVHSEYGDYTYESGRKVVAQYLKNNEWDIDIIFAHNDDMALGAIEELKKREIPIEDLTIVSVDATREALQSIIQGELSCAVECNPLTGPTLMKAVREMMAGKEMPMRIITEEKVYDASNAAEVLSERKY